MLKSLQRKELQLTDRDLEAMVSLYHNSILAAGHLKNLFWEGRQYGYLRLRMLDAAGYVKTFPFKEKLPGRKRKKRKLTSFYYLTRRGLEAVQNVIPEPLPPARRPVSSKKLYELLQMGELWCTLLEKGAIADPGQWLPSRLAKHRLGLPAYVPLHCVVLPDSGEYTALYYVPREADRRAISLLHNFLPRVAEAGVPRRVLVCADLRAAARTFEVFTRRFSSARVFVQTHDQAREVLPLVLAGNREAPYREVTGRLQRLFGEVKLQPAGPLSPGPLYFEFRGRRLFHVYVTELITGDVSQLARLVHMVPQPELDPVYLYVPSLRFFNAVRKLLPADLPWLRLVLRDRPPGEDVIREVQ